MTPTTQFLCKYIRPLRVVNDGKESSRQHKQFPKATALPDFLFYEAASAMK